MRITSTRALAPLLLALVAMPARPVQADDDLAERVNRSREVYQELVNSPDRKLPENLRQDCRCVAVLPRVIKGAIGVGARFGKGVVTCRNAQGAWSPIGFIHLTGGSWGFQIGAEAADVVLFFMTERGAQSLLQSKFTLGGKLGVAAGPVGRTAEAATDLKLNAEIYSYAKTKGLFAGLSLEGARLAVDNESDRQYYGVPITAREILFEQQVPRRPAEMETFLQALR